jgi:hypothetical protein
LTCRARAPDPARQVRGSRWHRRRRGGHTTTTCAPPVGVVLPGARESDEWAGRVSRRTTHGLTVPGRAVSRLIRREALRELRRQPPGTGQVAASGGQTQDELAAVPLAEARLGVIRGAPFRKFVTVAGVPGNFEPPLDGCEDARLAALAGTYLPRWMAAGVLSASARRLDRRASSGRSTGRCASSPMLRGGCPGPASGGRSRDSRHASILEDVEPRNDGGP